MDKFKKKIIKLNNSPKFQAIMDYETREKMLTSTAKLLGFEEGEKQSKIEIVKNLLKHTALSTVEIARNTGLTSQEIKSLKRNRDLFCLLF